MVVEVERLELSPSTSQGCLARLLPPDFKSKENDAVTPLPLLTKALRLMAAQ